MSWAKKRYFVEYKSNRFDRLEYDTEKKEYGTYNHCYSVHASTIKTAKTYFNRIRKEFAEENPRDFRIYDSFADVDAVTNYVPCVYSEERK